MSGDGGKEINWLPEAGQHSTADALRLQSQQKPRFGSSSEKEMNNRKSASSAFEGEENEEENKYASDNRKRFKSTDASKHGEFKELPYGLDNWEKDRDKLLERQSKEIEAFKPEDQLKKIAMIQVHNRELEELLQKRPGETSYDEDHPMSGVD